MNRPLKEGETRVPALKDQAQIEAVLLCAFAYGSNADRAWAASHLHDCYANFNLRDGIQVVPEFFSGQTPAKQTRLFRIAAKKITEAIRTLAERKLIEIADGAGRNGTHYQITEQGKRQAVDKESAAIMADILGDNTRTPSQVAGGVVAESATGRKSRKRTPPEIKQETAEDTEIIELLILHALQIAKEVKLSIRVADSHVERVGGVQTIALKNLLSSAPEPRGQILNQLRQLKAPYSRTTIGGKSYICDIDDINDVLQLLADEKHIELGDGKGNDGAGFYTITDKGVERLTELKKTYKLAVAPEEEIEAQSRELRRW
ncbi:MAG: hypothetical protein SFX19_02795 [Alphaproteobacteria bacterium]|nr:hypothetical protein [Alphaproteobacteria bacterium]